MKLPPGLQVFCLCCVLFLVFIGYNLAAEGGVKAMLDEFDLEVGLHYLRAIHLNDSKGTAKDTHTERNAAHLG